MIPLTFVEPNFKCVAIEPNGRRHVGLYFADSEDQLRDHLERKGFSTVAIEKYEFQEWRVRAAEATLKAIKERRDGHAHKYNESLWSEIKQFLFTLSKNKCGYCESKVKHTSPGHVEHYRPKRKVAEDPEHPGYYWLAYDPQNFVPCCPNCNSGPGKQNHFPVALAHYARNPEENIESEHPLLLNPFRHQTIEHLEFLGPQHERKFGHLRGISVEGETSVQIYNLNRYDLVEERKKSYEFFRKYLDRAIAPLANQGTIDKEELAQTLREFAQSVSSGEEPYCLVLLPLLNDRIDQAKAITTKLILEDAVLLNSLQNDLQMLNTGNKHKNETTS